MDDADLLRAIGVEGPVTAEIYVVARDGERLRLSGPCGPEPWLVEAAVEVQWSPSRTARPGSPCPLPVRPRRPA